MSAPDLPEIIDIHTHFMPQRVLDKVWAYFDSAGPLIGRPWPITYREDEGGRLAALRALGVRAFTSLNYAHRPAMAQWLNDWSSEFAAKHDDVLHSATFYPEPGAADYTAAAIEAGARIFKAHVQVGDYSLADPLLDDVWPVLERSRTTMAFTDFTQATSPFPRERMDDLVALGDRVLFGSDFPNIPYPYEHAVDAVRRLGLGEEWERKVLHDNAARLFGIR